MLHGVQALVEDARIYLDAELNFQKSRAGFVAGRVKLVAGLACAGLFLALLSTVALALGLIFALAELVGAWGATGIVVLALLLLAALLAWQAARVWRGMVAALHEEPADG